MKSQLAHVTASAATTMVLATSCMALMDATSKHLVQQYSATFVVWVRYCIQALLLLLLVMPRLPHGLLTQSVGRREIADGSN